MLAKQGAALRTLAACFCFCLLWLPVSALADPPSLSDQLYLPGDQGRVSAVDVQEFSRLAPGGPGYLAVWEERRSVLSGWVNMGGDPLGGGGIDIYAMRLDADGRPLDPGPILVCQDGRNQTKPQTAWNEAAQAWLVVWTTERPDWYFFEDIVGARVSASGQVLDPTPIPLRLQNNDPSNDQAQYPTVASDGNEWVVVWVDLLWQGYIPYPNVAAKRVSAGGVVIDPAPVVLYQHPDDVFGPIVPHLAWAADEYLVVWERSGYYDIYGKRINAALQTIGPNSFLVTSDGYGPRVASNGTDFLVTSRYNRAHRVTHSGASLDPMGIALLSPGGWDFRGPDVAWNGLHWCVVNAGAQGGHYSIWLSRISTGGAILGTNAVQDTGQDQFNATVASRGGGSSEVTWGERHVNLNYMENVRGSRVDAGGAGSPAEDVSAGLRRQSHVRFARNGNEAMAVFVSQCGGTTRILAQRVDGMGNPIDLEPVEIMSTIETSRFIPSVAWNGSYYVIVWADRGSIYGRRLDAGGAPVDPSPVLLLANSASDPVVGALGTSLLLAYTFTFSGDQNYLKAVRLDATTMSLIGSAAQIGPGFVIPFVQVREFGGRWFVVYEAQANHDVPASLIKGIFVEPSGSAAPAFTISGSGDDDQPGLAVGGDQALVTWADRNTYPSSAIFGRLIRHDGTFPNVPFVISEVAGEQLFTTADWDGNEYVAAWSDYRSVDLIEQQRADIWAARIGAGGEVLDPGGFQVTDGPLPEDLPQVTGGGGRAIIAYCRMHGPGGPEVQRIGYRILGLDPASVPAGAGAEEGWRVGPLPFRRALNLSFPAPASSATRVEVFSLDGRCVFRHPVAEGATAFIWDGRDGTGRSLPAGGYFLRVCAGTRSLFERRLIRLEAGE